MNASLARGTPHGYEVGYTWFTINGRMLGHGEPVRVKAGERVLFHVLNGSATEIRSLALPGHSFQVVALDGNSLATPTQVPVLWIGAGERVSAIVEMTRPGVWVLGDVSDDRGHGMGVVVEYAGAKGKPQWSAPPPFKWNWEHRLRPSGRRDPGARRDFRPAHRQGQRGRSRLQSVEPQRRGVSETCSRRRKWRRANGRPVQAASGQALSPAPAQRHRRHSSAAPASPQLRGDAHRRHCDSRSNEGRVHAGRLSVGRSRFHGRQSRPPEVEKLERKMGRQGQGAGRGGGSGAPCSTVTSNCGHGLRLHVPVVRPCSETPYSRSSRRISTRPPAGTAGACDATRTRAPVRAKTEISDESWSENGVTRRQPSPVTSSVARK